uniref:Uncharacterized protein n=1 Tax=Arundo donax TaxID=35708 RepID=A0A0A9A9H3_ARUDO
MPQILLVECLLHIQIAHKRYMLPNV